MSANKFFAIVAGAGPGTGRAAAVRFAKAYPVVLLTRTPESHRDAVTEINESGGRALGISADTSDPASVKTAFETISKEFADYKLAAAVYNAAGGFVRKPFLETSVEDIDVSLAGSVRGFYLFSKAVLPLLLSSVPESPHPPTLLVTGATASVRGSLYCGTFAAGMNARRALSQSLAREFGPQGIHVAHAVIDGVIDIPRTQSYNVNGGVKDGKIDPAGIAESYWHLHTQPRSAFTQEIDLRPFVEKF
jgi:NAD(P)-dependent dehydrogenase (short-subunit alcohol dehydrogenase family)